MQRINITGRVGTAAETRQAGGSDVTSFSCAVDQGWGDKKQTNWYRVSIWGQRGPKLAPYINKGDKVAVSGELIIGEYNGKPQFEIRADDVDCFFGNKQNGGAPQATTDRTPAPAFEDDEVPFATSDAALEWRVS